MIHCFEYLARGLYCLLKLLRCDQKADVGRYVIFPRKRQQARAARPHHSFFSSSRNRNVKAVWLPNRKKYGAKPFQYANTPSLRPILTRASSKPLHHRSTMSRTDAAQEARGVDSSGGDKPVRHCSVS